MSDLANNNVFEYTFPSDQIPYFVNLLVKTNHLPVRPIQYGRITRLPRKTPNE